MRTSSLCFALLSLLFGIGSIAGCGGSKGDPPQTTDGGSEDGGGTDGGASTNAPLGGYCTVGAGSSTPCDTGLSCYNSSGAAAGFCGTDCATASCPMGTTCRNLLSKVCMKTCTFSPDCPTGDVCADTGNNVYVCVPDCRVHADTCAPGYACSPALGFCLATGGQGFGQPCKTTTNPCKAGLDCMKASSSAANGFCTQICDTTPCPTTPSGATCTLHTPTGTGYCGWSCTGPSDTSCPAGLSCLLMSGSTYLCQ